jgi:hypothetical protein
MLSGAGRFFIPCSLHQKRMGGKSMAFAAARPWVVLKLQQSC